MDAEVPIDFLLTLTRDGDFIDFTTSYTATGYESSGTVEDIEILATKADFDFTFNTIGFLIGGSMNGGKASFSNIDVSTSSSGPPATLAAQILAVDLVAKTVTLEWNSTPDQKYDIFSSSDLLGDPRATWLEEADKIESEGTTTQTVIDLTDPVPSTRFFQVLESQP